MDPMPLSLLMSRAATLRLVRSAEPDAPVVEPRTPRPHHPHAVRTRSALAAALRRAAEAVTPDDAHGVGHAA